MARRTKSCLRHLHTLDAGTYNRLNTGDTVEIVDEGDACPECADAHQYHEEIDDDCVRCRPGL